MPTGQTYRTIGTEGPFRPPYIPLQKQFQQCRKRRSGIYLGRIFEEDRNDNKTIDVYVGSSVRIETRTLVHKTSNHWPHSKGSRLYEKLHRGKRVDFSVLAALNSTIERGYIYLLEAIFTFLFDTLLEPPIYHKYVRRSTWDLYKDLCGSVSHPPKFGGQVFGLNLTWQLIQAILYRLQIESQMQ